MKIIPEANNHVKLELDMSTNCPIKTLDILEGAMSGVRFIIVSVFDKKEAAEEITIDYTDEEGNNHTFKADVVKISIGDRK